MEFPPQHIMLFPDADSVGYDLCSSESPYGSRALASSCHNPIPPTPPPPTLLDSVLQSDRVRMELAEESRRKAAVFLRILEGNAGGWMREREVEWEWARKRNGELGARLIKTELASRRWPWKGKRSWKGSEEEERNMMVWCRVCHRQSSSVLVLPGRHLCSCQPCEPALSSSPVCQTRQKGSVNVRFL